MKKFAAVCAFASLFVAGSLALVMGQGQGQGPNPKSDDPFWDHGDRGELIHVLPPHANIRAQHDTQPVNAPPSNEASVYPASYGKGNLVNHGGPQISGASFVAIYWNGQVANSTRTSLGYGKVADQIAAFLTNFSGANWSDSPYDDYTIIQQYGAHDTISAALPSGVSFVDSQASKNVIKDGDIQRYLTGLFQSGRLDANTSTLYGIYFPPGMNVSLQGMSCSSFCGYHSYLNYRGTAIKYAVFPYLDCPACSLAGKSVADMLTIVTSHEIREAVTDPLLNAWYVGSGYEADDKCAWHNLYQMNGGGFWVQPEYSNGLTVSGKTFSGPGCVVPTPVSPAPAQHLNRPAPQR
jgi:hypothetical protein